jgi:hypothetical protein
MPGLVRGTQSITGMEREPPRSDRARSRAMPAARQRECRAPARAVSVTVKLSCGDYTCGVTRPQVRSGTARAMPVAIDRRSGSAAAGFANTTSGARRAPRSNQSWLSHAASYAWTQRAARRSSNNRTHSPALSREHGDSSWRAPHTRGTSYSSGRYSCKIKATLIQH